MKILKALHRLLKIGPKYSQTSEFLLRKVSTSGDERVYLDIFDKAKLRYPTFLSRRYRKCSERYLVITPTTVAGYISGVVEDGVFSIQIYKAVPKLSAKAVVKEFISLYEDVVFGWKTHIDNRDSIKLLFKLDGVFYKLSGDVLEGVLFKPDCRKDD